MRVYREIAHASRNRQEGGILLIVLFFIIMFTGLGLLAMRHTRAELRSAGHYLDNSQCGELARAGTAMAATDLRLYFDERCDDDRSHLNDLSNLIYTPPPYKLRFSPAFQGDIWPANDCPVSAGSVPDPEDVGAFQADAGLALSPIISAEPRAKLTMEHSTPLRAVPPPGFSVNCEDWTYCWYDFRFVSRAEYGIIRSSTQKSRFVSSGCSDRGQMRVGPIRKFD